MTHKDAYMFPVFGSCVLFGLYLLFKFLSKEYINYLLTAYFLLFGIGNDFESNIY
jgi:minor histocompatibility antigen H13